MRILLRLAQKVYICGFVTKSHSFVLVCHLDYHFAFLPFLMLLNRRILLRRSDLLLNWLILLQKLRFRCWCSIIVNYHEQAARCGGRRCLAFSSLHDKFRCTFDQLLLLVRLNRLDWRQKPEIKRGIWGHAERPIRDFPSETGCYSLLDHLHFRGVRGGLPAELLSDQFCRAEVFLDELRPEAAEKKAFEVFALVDAHLELRILEDANHLLQLLLDLVSILHFCHCF